MECENNPQKKYSDSLTDFNCLTNWMIIGEVSWVLWPKVRSVYEIEKQIDHERFGEESKETINKITGPFKG